MFLLFLHFFFRSKSLRSLFICFNNYTNNYNSKKCMHSFTMVKKHGKRCMINFLSFIFKLKWCNFWPKFVHVHVFTCLEWFVWFIQEMIMKFLIFYFLDPVCSTLTCTNEPIVCLTYSAITCTDALLANYCPKYDN